MGQRNTRSIVDVDGHENGSDEQFPIVIHDSEDEDTQPNSSEPHSLDEKFTSRITRPGAQLAFAAEGIQCFVSGPGSDAGRRTQSDTTTSLRGGGNAVPAGGLPSNGFLAVQVPSMGMNDRVTAAGITSMRNNEPSVSTLSSSSRVSTVRGGAQASGGSRTDNDTHNQGSRQGESSPGYIEPTMPRLRGGGVVPQVHRGPRRDAVPTTTINAPGWDFNSNQPLPWSAPSRGPRRPQIREFSMCNDDALLDYLANRRVSTGFLFEIDQFLRCNVPMIEKYAPEFVELTSSLPPLEAYLYFVKGYTRPARYLEGVILATPFSLPPNFVPTSLLKIHDQELDDFFAGFEYRYDILERIDMEVLYACNEIRRGNFLSIRPDLRRLVCYAVYGNPADAYKFYEYNYQQDYMPHRYLPEHVVLGNIPKPRDYTEPEPSLLHSWRSYRHVRDQMARAKDQGVDVIDVLMKEYRTVLVKRGLRRVEMDNYCSQAQMLIDRERHNPKGLDVVDMVMDDAERHSSTRPFARRASYRPSYNPTVQPNRGPSVRSNGANMSQPHGRKRKARGFPAFRKARAVLVTRYDQESNVVMNPFNYSLEDMVSVQKARGAAERQYVHFLTQYYREHRGMRPDEADKLRRAFSKRELKGKGPVYKNYLFSLFPPELN